MPKRRNESSSSSDEEPSRKAAKRASSSDSSRSATPERAAREGTVDSSSSRRDDSRDTITRERDRRYAEERNADRDRGRCEEIICVRTESAASSRETSVSRRGTSQEGESSEDKSQKTIAKMESIVETAQEVAKSKEGKIVTQDTPAPPKSVEVAKGHPDVLQLQAAESEGEIDEGPPPPSEPVETVKKIRGTVADSSSSGSESGDDTAPTTQETNPAHGKTVRKRRRSSRSEPCVEESDDSDSASRHSAGEEIRNRKKKKSRENRRNSESGTATDDERSDSDRRMKSKVVMVAPKIKDVEPPKKKTLDPMLTRTGGAYIPPAKLREMQRQITDKGSVEYQRIAWEALKKSINGLVNKVNVSNLKEIVYELFRENLIRGRGILARSIMQAQAFSTTFTHVYAALAAVINSKFPQTGELILKRTILQFKRGFRRNDKSMCVAGVKFLAHLVNQQVAHEVVALEILTLLLEKPTEDSVEVSIAFLKEVGRKLTEVSPRGVLAIMERLRHILHEGTVDKRCQYMIEVLAAVRKDGFKDHPAVIAELDLVQEEDQFTHLISLEEVNDGQDGLNAFKFDPQYEENEEKYQGIYKTIVGESSSEGEDGSSSGSSSDDDSDDETAEAAKATTIVDNTETNLVALRRTIFLTIQSSLNYEECVHKLLKLQIQPNQIPEMCHMILDCCSQQRTYEKFFALIAQRLCLIRKEYLEPFCEIFGNAYDTVHRLDTNKLRNCAKFFASLLHSDAIPWQVLSTIKLSEETTNSSSRIFIKILFQELAEFMGLMKLNERIKDPTLQEAFDGLFPRDSPQNTRFAINFYTSIGLGGLTDDLRTHLKAMPKKSAK